METNYIDRRSCKWSAKQLMRETKPSPFFIALLVVMVSLLTTSLMGSITVTPVPEQVAEPWVEFAEKYAQNGFASENEMMDAYIGTIDGLLTYFTTDYRLNLSGKLLIIALRLVNYVLSIGFTVYCLHAVRKESCAFANLLDGFGVFLRMLWVRFLCFLVTAFFNLLLVIPGIIRFYAYRQVNYLRIDHPDWSAVRCMRESRAMMRGHKWELFMMDLSFIGWKILSIFKPVRIFSLPFLSLSYAVYYTRLSQTLPSVTGPADSDNGVPWEY